MAKAKKDTITVDGLWYYSAAHVRKRLKIYFDIDAPISGGYGSSTKDLIVINESDVARSALLEGDLVMFMENTDPEAKKVSFKSSSIMKIGRKTIAKYSISITFKSRIEDKTFNWDKDFYFDVSKSFNKK